MLIHPLESECLADFSMPAVWNHIRQAYSEPHRAYHTLEHLSDMFAHHAAVAERLHYPLTVRRAIWFHDYVYRTEAEHYPRNETASAAAMTSLLQAACPALTAQTENGLPCAELAGAMILATKHHRPALGGFDQHPEAIADCCVLLDLDLAILAQSRERVMAFDDGVRLEFSRYADEVFAAGRIQALQGFLERDRIYLSPAFSAREAVARENLAMLITRWQQRLC